jgi:hypothetical protein
VRRWLQVTPNAAGADRCQACSTSPGSPTRSTPKALGPALRAHAERPAAQVVQRRLDRLPADLERRRNWAAGMQADADARAGRADVEVPLNWTLPVRDTSRFAIVLASLALLFWWLRG